MHLYFTQFYDVKFGETSQIALTKAQLVSNIDNNNMTCKHNVKATRKALKKNPAMNPSQQVYTLHPLAPLLFVNNLTLDHMTRSAASKISVLTLHTAGVFGQIMAGCWWSRGRLRPSVVGKHKCQDSRDSALEKDLLFML